MAEALSVTLHALAEEVASGSSDPVDIGERRSAARLTLRRTTLSGAITVNVETAASESGPWRPAGQLVAGKAVHVARLMRYLRVSWTVGVPVEFEVYGDAHTIYATPEGIELPVDVLDDFTEEDKAEACITSSCEAEGYLNAGYTLPLAKWTPELARHAGMIAAWNLVRKRGVRADGADELVKTGRDEAIQWLSRVASGKIVPPGLVDSTPDEYDAGGFVISDAS